MSNEKEILALLQTNQAFTNPLSTIFNTTISSISINTTLLEANITSLCDLLWPSGVPYPVEFTNSDKLNIDNIINITNNTINSMITHTNTLSGAVITGNKNIIALLDLTITAKDTTDQWDKTKNINTHPLYESASVFFLKDEINNILLDNINIINNNISFFNSTSTSYTYIITNFPIPLDQKTFIRNKINEIYNAINIINSYLLGILSHDNTGWDSIQRKVYNKLFSIKLSSYSESNEELKEYFKIVSTEKLKKLF